MIDYKRKIDSVSESLNKVLEEIDDTKSTSGVPEASEDPKVREELAQYARSLHEEAIKFYEDHFGLTSHLRGYVGEPKTYWENCDKMKSGDHWSVYGRRNTDPGSEWKQERVDNQIGSQIRTRKSFIMGNWHDILVSPNINGINEVFDQERKKNGWSDTLDKAVDSAITYGDAQIRLILDKSEFPEGIVRPKYCDRGSIFRSPYSMSFKKIDNCWYAGEHTMISEQMIREYYPELNIDLLSPPDDTFLRKIGIGRDKKVYEHTKLKDMIEIFFDDPTLEEIPLSEEAMDVIVQEEQALTQGQNVAINDDDNDLLHLKTHKDALQNILSFTPSSEEDMMLQQQTAESYAMHIEAHQRRLSNESERKLSLKKKYPHGRYVCVIGGELADDIPNPYKIDWRRLFYELKNEKVVGRLDGRGDVEILYHDNKTIDTMMSRMDDASLTVAFPKIHYDLQDKENLEEYNNDPTKPIFVSRPPTPVASSMPDGWRDLLELARNNIQQRIGVNEVTRGTEQPSGTSNALVETLLQQNSVLVAGELNKNLNILLEEMVEAMFALYKVLYVEPRPYFITGTEQTIIVSDMISTGANLQFTVRPFSNFPNKWENEVRLLQELALLIDPASGAPLIPMVGQAIIDKLAERYPQFGKGGKYNQLPEAMKLGLEVMKQEEMMDKEDKKTIDMVNNKIRSEKVKELFPEQEEA